MAVTIRKSRTNLASLTIGDQLIVSGAGPHAIGGATDADFQVLVTGTFTPTLGSSSPAAIRLTSTLPVPATFSGYGIDIAPTLNEAGSGTHADFASLHVRPPIIGAGAAALTNASTLKITGAPTGASNNYSFWSDAGSVRIDGTNGAGVGAGTLTNAPSAGDPDKWIPINSDGTQYWVPAWAA